MKTSLLRLALCLPLLVSCASAPTAPGPLEGSWFAHDVYFDLKDDSAEAREAFVQDCWDQLAGLDGVRFFACGLRDETLTRPVNAQDYDVALHVVFDDRAAQDAYQVHPNHLGLVEKYKDAWHGVRVCDSHVRGEFMP